MLTDGCSTACGVTLAAVATRPHGRGTSRPFLQTRLKGLVGNDQILIFDARWQRNRGQRDHGKLNQGIAPAPRVWGASGNRVASPGSYAKRSSSRGTAT